MKIISIVNQKGGVGKTNVAINLSAQLALFHYKTLLIDMDPQGNASRGLGFDTSLIDKSIIDVFDYKVDVKLAIKKTIINGLDLLPSKLAFSINKENDNNFYLLNDVLLGLKEEYEYVIIDCPPSLGNLTINSLVASEKVIIPVQCQYFALNGVTQTLSTIANIKNLYNSKLSISGALLTMYDEDSDLDNEIVNEIKLIFKDHTFGSKIPRTNSIPESNLRGIPVLLWRPSGKASNAFYLFTKEVLEK